MTRTTALAALLLASGCASYGGAGLRPGVDAKPQVLAVMGEPQARYPEPAGEAWAYPRGPAGFDTFIARFDAAGRLTALDKVLDPAHFARIVAGMSPLDVGRAIGPPWRKERFASRGETAWDYRFMDTWGYPSQFSVIFDARNLVLRTHAFREPYDQDD